MKKFLVYCMVFSFCYPVTAQEKKELVVKSEVKDVMVYLNGAQVTRNKTIDLSPGRTILRFSELSPFLDEKSIQVSANKGVTVMGVNSCHKDSTLVSEEWESLNKKALALADKIKMDSAQMVIIQEEMKFLKENRSIGGKNQEISYLNLKSTASFYDEQISGFILKELETSRDMETSATELESLHKKMSQINSTRKLSYDEIILEVDAKTAISSDFAVSYFVNEAGWNSFL